MKERSGTNLIRVRADQLPPASRDELDRLERLMEDPIDTSEIPPVSISKHRRSPIRQAILKEMRQQGHTGHRLWKLARAFCPRLPESAVYEFMADKRSVRVDYADAMLQALKLRLTPSKQKRAG